MKWLLALVLALAASPAGATSLAGSATVIDGDTVEISGKRIRLFGIDAPEATQKCDRNGEKWACGRDAADHLRTLIGNGELSCRGNEVDTYGRLVAVCTVAGVDLNQVMVAQGWATAFRRYSDQYIGDEARARASKLGLWASNFMSPEEYRAAERGEQLAPVQSSRALPRVQAASRSTSSACAIKGNRGKNGWIYHTPGMRYYAETQAEEMFCTEAQAQAAGYRRARAG